MTSWNSDPDRLTPEQVQALRESNRATSAYARAEFDDQKLQPQPIVIESA